ncbi:ecdysone-induced protein 63F 1 [Leptinotarsa decemlineata]|uniref:ecdysone-induced protein 63F 1 n=1 Tax=Leptinotarsa decemlineata TaxID=7539 RepID=UPI003D307E6C
MASFQFNRRRSSSIKKEFSEKELEGLKTAFQLLDRNQDGKVTPGEFKIMLNNLGIEIKYQKAEEIIRSASHSGIDIIDQNDFLSFVKTIQQATPGPEDEDLTRDLTAAFKVFDLDGDGFITREELKVAMEMIGETVTDEQIDQVIVLADTDKDGKINYEEFVKLLTS